MKDKQYLDNILETIQDRENLNENIAGLGAVFVLLTYLSLHSYYKTIRTNLDKAYAKCQHQKGDAYKKCMLTMKIAAMTKAVEVASKVGPEKCKLKKDQKACMQKVKKTIEKTKQQIKVLQAKISTL